MGDGATTRHACLELAVIAQELHLSTRSRKALRKPFCTLKIHAFWQPARKVGAADTMEESSGNICRTESAISEIKASMHGESFCRFHPLPDRNMILQRIDSKARQNRDEPILSTKTLKDFEFPVKEPALNAPMYISTTAKDNPSLQSLPDSINKQAKSATSNSEENPPVSVKKKRKCFSWLFS